MARLRTVHWHVYVNYFVSHLSEGISVAGSTCTMKSKRERLDLLYDACIHPTVDASTQIIT